MESLIKVSYANLILKEKIWAKLEILKAPTDLDGNGMIGYYMFNIKAYKEKEEDDIFIVYTNSSLYPSLSRADLLIISEQGIDEGVRIVAYKNAIDKLKALRKKLFLNQARGAFKKVERDREEISRHINYMRDIKRKQTVFLI